MKSVNENKEMEMPGAMSVYLMQFKAITVTWREGIHHRSSPTCGWKTCSDQHGSSNGLLAEGICLWGHNLKFELDFFHGLLGLLFLHRYLSPTRKWWSQLLSRRDVIFVWTLERKWILWCCSFAVAEYVLHVKMISEFMCVGVGYLNSVMVEILNTVVN